MQITQVVAYRLSAKKPIGRSAGRSVVNSAAYISRSKLKDNELGETFSYQHKSSDILFSEIITPKVSPYFSTNRELLWNAVQKYETHKKAQFARALELNLPYELNLNEMTITLTKFVENNFIRLGMIADVNLHKPDKDGDERNYHAHILLTLRRVNEQGFVGNKAREWNSRELFKQWREKLALECSLSLEMAGYKTEAERWRHGHLTLNEQYKMALVRGDESYAKICDHAPTKHKGVHIHQMEKKGIISYVEEDRKKLRALEEKKREEELSQLEAEHQALMKEELELEDETIREKFKHLYPRLEDRNVPIPDELRKIHQKYKNQERDPEREYERQRGRDDDYER